jgi:hypothetical protein
MEEFIVILKMDISKFTLTPKLPNDTLTAKILSYSMKYEEAKLFMAVASQKSRSFLHKS